MAVGVGGDEDATTRRGTLKPAGPVDDVADGDELLPGPVAERADDHVAGVDADAHLERDAVIRRDPDDEIVERRASTRIDNAIATDGP